MNPGDQLVAARRWAKFPATVLFATGILWLLEIIFNRDAEAIRQLSETGVGVLWLLVDMLLIPLGSVTVALGLLYLQSWAMWCGLFLPVFPLVMVTADKYHRTYAKFADFRATGNTDSLGDGVMTTLLVFALWAVYVLIVAYLFKMLSILQGRQLWLRRPVRDSGGVVAVAAAQASSAGGEEGDLCQLFPESDIPVDDHEQ